jgi:type I restriction enzyme, S subunit
MKDATFSSARLLALYDRISDAEDAVPRLRSFVLNLAVRGKLVEQDASEEPAAELLKLIVRERNARVKSGQIRKGKPNDPIDAAPWETPSGWVWLPLGDAGNIFTGNSINAVTRERLEKTSVGHPFIATKDVGYGLDPIAYDNGLLVSTSDESFKVARAQSVLICAEGGSAGRKIGITDREICFGNKLLANETWSVVSPRYVLFVYQSSFFFEQFAEQMTGIIGGISINKFLQLPFPLPPLAEQHRIVAKVDELMALCDQLEQARARREAVRDRLTTASLARLTAPETDAETFQSLARFALQSLPNLTTRPDQIKTLRQTILNLAVRGKLVAQDAADEPAAELLRKLDREIASYCEANRIRQTVGDPIVQDETPEPVPSGWVWARLCSLFKVITDGDHQAPPKADSGIAFLTIGNITTGELDFEGCRLVPESYYQSLVPYRTPTRGDILYTVVGATYGRPAIVKADRAFCVQRHIAILKPTSGMSLRYLAYLLSSPLVYDQATKGTTGTAQPTIALRPLRNFLVPLPPLAEQHHIVAKVDALMALCDQLEASLTTTATTRSKLLNALLHEALEPAGQAMEAAE